MRVLTIVIILSFVTLLSGCLKVEEQPMVSEKVVSEEWIPDGKVGAGEYSSCMVLRGPAKQGYTGGEMTLCWKSDQEYLYMAMNGSSPGWLAVGFDPSQWMKEADIILGSVDNGKATVLDEYSTGNYGPHIEDTLMGGTDDILESGGSSDGIHMVVEFKRKLNTGDSLDKVLPPQGTISIIWAMADKKDPAIKHNIAYGEGILTLGGVQAATTAEAPSPRDVQGMRFIWEEEKVARDLYVSLYNQTNLSIFLDLVRSEQNHMDQVKVVMDRYGVAKPVPDDYGVFENQTLIQIYDDLLARGMQSNHEALKASATFEEVSIMDLQKEIDATDNQDIVVVYQGLLAGSRKHLRSYVNDLKDQGISYTPQYLSRTEYDQIMGEG